MDQWNLSSNKKSVFCSPCIYIKVDATDIDADAVDIKAAKFGNSNEAITAFNDDDNSGKFSISKDCTDEYEIPSLTERTIF